MKSNIAIHTSAEQETAGWSAWRPPPTPAGGPCARWWRTVIGFHFSKAVGMGGECEVWKYGVVKRGAVKWCSIQFGDPLCSDVPFLFERPPVCISASQRIRPCAHLLDCAAHPRVAARIADAPEINKHWCVRTGLFAPPQIRKKI